RAYVAELLLGGPEALAATKQVLHQVPQLPREDALRWAAALSAERFASEEGVEGMRAFTEKRLPRWAT
ncbi:MAG: enoyl-CoA hydratase, partial [Actinomycetota bacterium]|nr:enoyl-CoA hydratase [Actinomycetota bacterium]